MLDAELAVLSWNKDGPPPNALQEITIPLIPVLFAFSTSLSFPFGWWGIATGDFGKTLFCKFINSPTLAMLFS